MDMLFTMAIVHSVLSSRNNLHQSMYYLDGNTGCAREEPRNGYCISLNTTHMSTGLVKATSCEVVSGWQPLALVPTNMPKPV